MRRIEASGVTYGRLMVVGEAAKRGNQRYVLASCSCGSGVAEYRLSHLRSGRARSCRCLVAESNRSKPSVHGQVGTRAYNSWASMLDRCRNPHSLHYNRYGGRGISVCERWLDFKLFFEDMGQPPEGCTIDRINGDLGYCKENCRWATAKQQAVNRRTTVFVTLDGEVMPVSHASQRLGLGKLGVSRRVSRGWSIEKAMNGRGGYA